MKEILCVQRECTDLPTQQLQWTLDVEPNTYLDSNYPQIRILVEPTLTKTL